MDKFFKITERGSTVGTEILGGVTTFFTMAYIIIVNPSILVSAGVPFDACLTATCFSAALTTAIMGLIVNRPVALAAGMGLNAMIAGLCVGGVDWHVAMACVFVEGIICLVLVLMGLREAIMKAIPFSLRQSIGIGIGLFIAFMGLRDCGIVVPSEATGVAFGDITAPSAIVGLVSIALAAILQARKVTGALLWSIVGATLVGIPLGLTVLPEDWSIGIDFSAFAAPFHTTPDGAVALLKVFTEPMLLLFVFSFLMSDFFDTMGAVLAIAKKAEFDTPDGDVKDAKAILAVDSGGAIIGGFFGASSLTTYIESSAGASAGARTGLSNLVIAVLFVLAAFFGPVLSVVPTAATAGTLVVVGYLMLAEVTTIDWSKIELALPAFLVIIGIPLFSSITSGIGAGFIFYCIIMVFMGRAREVHPLMWGASAAFLANFLITALL